MKGQTTNKESELSELSGYYEDFLKNFANKLEYVEEETIGGGIV